MLILSKGFHFSSIFPGKKCSCEINRQNVFYFGIERKPLGGMTNCENLLWLSSQACTCKFRAHVVQLVNTEDTGHAWLNDILGEVFGFFIKSLTHWYNVVSNHLGWCLDLKVKLRVHKTEIEMEVSVSNLEIIICWISLQINDNYKWKM